MNSEVKIMSRQVWSGAIRLAHGLLLVSVLALMSTGWLIANSPLLAQDASEIHQMIAALFAVSLGFRLLLLFIDKNSGHWKRMFQAWPSFAQAGEMMLFYLTLGRSKLPNWYAHNFLWVPLYFVLFLVLLLQTVIGVMMIYDIQTMAFFPRDVHVLLASLVFWFVVLHLYAVILHELKGRNANVSAMINGYRYFEADLGPSSADTKPSSVKVDFNS